ncbi:MAG: hypothetical protein IPH62_18135 [Ignavibacteriae bacterium]|nr:hypothetical protein [Ignavibacteriota bacterium]
MITVLNDFVKKNFIFAVLNYCILIFYFCYPIFNYGESPFLQTSSSDYIYSTPLSEFAVLPGKLKNTSNNSGSETNVENLKYVHIFANDLEFSSHLKFFKYVVHSSNFRKLTCIVFKLISRAPPAYFTSN